jgi:hypothetical protein
MPDIRAHVVNSLPGKWGRTQDLGDGRLLLQSSDNTRLCVTNGRLEPMWERKIPMSRGTHSVSSDLSRIAICLPEELRLLDSAGRTVGRFPHAPWDQFSSGACTFDRDGRHLWATVPAPDDTHLVVLELDALREVDRARLESQPAGLEPIHHPDRRSIGWSIGEGQDRVLIRWSALVGGRIQLRLLPDEDRVLIAIHPSGREYITTPHSTGPLQRRRFEDDAVIDELDSPEDLFWDFVAGYLDAERVLAAIRTDDEEGMLLLNRDPMKIAAKVISEGSVNPYWSLHWIGQGRWVTAGDEASEVWSLD